MKAIALNDSVLSFSNQKWTNMLPGQHQGHTDVHQQWRLRMHSAHMYSSKVLKQALQGLAWGGPFLEGIHFQRKSGKQIVMSLFLFCFHFLKKHNFNNFLMLTSVIYKKFQDESWLPLISFILQIKPQSTSNCSRLLRELN